MRRLPAVTDTTRPSATSRELPSGQHDANTYVGDVVNRARSVLHNAIDGSKVAVGVSLRSSCAGDEQQQRQSTLPRHRRCNPAASHTVSAALLVLALSSAEETRRPLRLRRGREGRSRRPHGRGIARGGRGVGLILGRRRGWPSPPRPAVTRGPSLPHHILHYSQRHRWPTTRSPAEHLAE